MSQKRCFFKAFFKLRCASACSNPPTYRWGHNIGLCLIMQPTSHMHVLKESPEQLHNTPLGMNKVFNTNTEMRVISAVTGTRSTWAFIFQLNATDETSCFLREKSCQICSWDMTERLMAQVLLNLVHGTLIHADYMININSSLISSLSWLFCKNKITGVMLQGRISRMLMACHCQYHGGQWELCLTCSAGRAMQIAFIRGVYCTVKRNSLL